MNRQTSHIVLSKSVLQNITTHIKIEGILNQVYAQVGKEAQRNKKSYKFDLMHHHNVNLLRGYTTNTEEETELIICEVMNAFNREFPGCKVERIKTIGYENKIVENFIVIDWS